uniref:Uncharacterized protein n=1 Tax=Lutzomyia longipalpis TaxID=7200 RepID=A0A1B0CV15_LUTLO
MEINKVALRSTPILKQKGTPCVLESDMKHSTAFTCHEETPQYQSLLDNGAKNILKCYCECCKKFYLHRRDRTYRMLDRIVFHSDIDR